MISWRSIFTRPTPTFVYSRYLDSNSQKPGRLQRATVCLFVGLFLSVIGAAESAAAQVTPATQRRPNILLIVADDMGYSDLGAFGGEIPTPHMDKLAKSGVILTNFYASPTCSPTRAMLLSGVDHHLAGLGSMAETLTPNQQGKPGYEGYLNSRVVSVASVLRDAGYHTYMAGKWHLGYADDQSPMARGFERSYALLQGAGHHFNDNGVEANEPKSTYREDDKIVKRPNGVYSTDLWERKLLGFIDSNHGDGKPFFAYLAYTAPHWPLQAPTEAIRKYKGKYDVGYDVIRRQRLERMRKLGIIPKDAETSSPPPNVPAWKTLTAKQKKNEARLLEIYAAMVDLADQSVGRILDHLRAKGELDNTLIVFFSDNGASEHDPYNDGTQVFQEFLRPQYDNNYDNLGTATSFAAYSGGWASVVTSPFRLFKSYTTEGGIRVPFFVTGYGVEKHPRVAHSFATVLDLAPTFLDIAGVKHPSTYEGRKVEPLGGASMLPFLHGKQQTIHPEGYGFGWELFGRRAARKGEWKVVWVEKPMGTSDWQLYNLREDIAERNDLSSQFPDKRKELIELWNAYAKRVGVVLPEGPLEH
jgi:arylsulfatase A-like enzyme